MNAERPVDTVERWVFEDWIHNDYSREELITKLHSISNETNRVADTSYYDFKNGFLVDPDTGIPILEFIAKGVEYEIAEDLQRRVANSDEGVFIWNSPKLDGFYPCNKTMLYQIAYNTSGQKVLTYSAILYDGEVQNPEQHRKTLVSASDTEETIISLLSWIEQVSGQKQDMGKTGFSRNEASYFAEQFKAGIDPRIILEEMQASGFIGLNSVSCAANPQSFSNYTSAKANVLIFSTVEDEYGPLTFKCSKGHENVRPHGKLLKNCQVCGEDVSCGNAHAV